MNEYWTWAGDWYRRIRNVYRDTTLPGPWRYLMREHPALALCHRHQRRVFPLGRPGRALGLVLCLTVEVAVALAVAHALRWDLSSLTFLVALYVIGIVVGLGTFSVFSMAVKHYGQRRKTCRLVVLSLFLLCIVGATGAAIALLVMALWSTPLVAPDQRVSVLLRVMVHAAVSYVATLLLEVPYHLVLRLCKPSGVSTLLLVTACCRLRTIRPWLHPERFEKFFQNDVNVGGDAESDAGSTRSYVPMMATSGAEASDSSLGSRVGMDPGDEAAGLGRPTPTRLSSDGSQMRGAPPSPQA